jgi:hypothetical protein
MKTESKSFSLPCIIKKTLRHFSFYLYVHGIHPRRRDTHTYAYTAVLIPTYFVYLYQEMKLIVIGYYPKNSLHTRLHQQHSDIRATTYCFLFIVDDCAEKEHLIKITTIDIYPFLFCLF